MEQEVGLRIIRLIYGQDHLQIDVKLCGLYGQWVEHGCVHICGSTTNLH